MQSILQGLCLEEDINRLLWNAKNINEIIIEEFKKESLTYAHFFTLEATVLLLSSNQRMPQKWAYFKDLIHILCIDESTFNQCIHNAEDILLDVSENYCNHLNKI